MASIFHSKDEWHTPAEVSKTLKVDEEVIGSLIERGEIEAVRVESSWRISREALLSFRARQSNRRVSRIRAWINPLRLAVITAGFGAIILTTVVIRAQTAAVNNPAIIPYQGYLEYDGAPVNGPTQVTFVLENDAGEALDWTETHKVTAHAGRFSAQLGAGNSINGYLDQGPLYLSISVQALDDEWNPLGEPASLTGRQLLASVPYALSGAPGRNFEVDGELHAASATMDGNLNAGGVLSVGGESTECSDSGSLRLDSSSGRLQSCNGSTWAPLSHARFLESPITLVTSSSEGTYFSGSNSASGLDGTLNLTEIPEASGATAVELRFSCRIRGNDDQFSYLTFFAAATGTSLPSSMSDTTELFENAQLSAACASGKDSSTGGEPDFDYDATVTTTTVGLDSNGTFALRMFSSTADSYWAVHLVRFVY